MAIEREDGENCKASYWLGCTRVDDLETRVTPVSTSEVMSLKLGPGHFSEMKSEIRADVGDLSQGSPRGLTCQDLCNVLARMRLMGMPMGFAVTWDDYTIPETRSLRYGKPQESPLDDR
jgi:hypothetical protein